MGMRFRKSVNLGGGVKFNFSKSGIGFSTGVKGARITKKANGGFRSTVSIPDTGISYVHETSKEKNSQNIQNVEYENLFNFKKRGYWKLFWVCRILWLPTILLSLLALIVTPYALISFSLGIMEIFYVKKYKEIKKGDD